MVGQLVQVTHDQGMEIGELYSINYRTGKALIFSRSPNCPHYFDVNISQISSLKLTLVPSTTIS